MDLMQKNSHKDYAMSQKQRSQTMYSKKSLQHNRRKPELTRINADNQTKQFLCKFWIVFLLFIVALAIISSGLPPALINITNKQQLKGTSLNNCNNPSVLNNKTLECQNFSQVNPVVGLIARDIKELNQFILISIFIEVANVNTLTKISQNVTYLIYDMKQSKSANGTTFIVDNMHQKQITLFQINSKNANKLYAKDGSTVIGYFQLIGVARDLDSQNLYLNMQFGNSNSSLAQFDNVVSVYLEGMKINSKFTRFTIAIRYFYFVLAIIAIFLYIKNLRKIPQQKITTEQKFIRLLAIFLLFFNDPLYPITILKPNMFSSFLSTAFVITFVVYLMFLWLVFTDRIYQQADNHEQSFRRIKIGYSIVFQILLIVLYMLYASYSLQDHPIVPAYDLSNGKYLGLQVVTAIWGVAGIVYMVIQFTRTCFKDGNLLWRHQMFIVYSVLYIFAMFVFFLVSNSFGSFSYNGSSILFLYSLMNMYTWYLMYMFSPSIDDSPDWRQPQIKSEDGISEGTIEFNDININLDKYSEKHSQKHSQIKNYHQYKKDHFNNDFSQKDQNAFQTEQQLNNQPKHFQQMINKQDNYQKEQIDFFNQNQIKNIQKKEQSPNKVQNLIQTEHPLPKQQPQSKKKQQLESDFGTFELQ